MLVGIIIMIIVLQILNIVYVTISYHFCLYMHIDEYQNM